MTRPSKIVFKGSVERHSDADELLKAPADTALIVRDVVRSLAIRCPDGCGELVTVNLDKRTGPAWRVYQEDEGLTLYPSVWRDTGCEAHFIIWKDELIWCDRSSRWLWQDDRVVEQVRSKLPSADEPHANFETIANDIGVTPWEALWACQTLEKRGIATSLKKTQFRLAKAPPSSKHRFDTRV